MSDEAGRDRCTALWKTYSVKCTTEEEEDTNGGEFAVRQVVADVTKRVTLFGISIDEEFSSPFPMDNNPEGRNTFSFIAAEKLIPRTYHPLEHNRW